MKTQISRLIVASLIVLLGCGTLQAQTFGKRLGKAVENAAKNTAVRKAEQKTEEAVSKAIDKALDPDTYSDDDANKNQNASGNDAAATTSGGAAQTAAGSATAASAADTPAALEMTYAKSDFVAGDEIMFDDNVVGEKVGEFPSMWDLKKGNVEIAQINGEKVILCVSQDDPVITPLMKDMKSYLPAEFTLEFDFWVGTYEKKGNDNPQNRYIIYFYKPESSSRVQTVDISSWYYNNSDMKSQLSWSFTSTSGDNRNGSDNSFRTIPNAWNHFSLSFNQRAMKVYVNGIRYANIPNTVAPGYFDIVFYRSGGYFTNNTSIRNVRIAKGAVPLYDRMLTDGKFITYGITFDVGKSTIKPESMGEINRIVTLMTENPDVKFSVEGHTDSTGNATSNQTLSEARSQAIVDKLVEMGVSAGRLQSAGKGQTTPIADNATDEGRAKNRRVEFVKI